MGNLIFFDNEKIKSIINEYIEINNKKQFTKLNNYYTSLTNTNMNMNFYFYEGYFKIYNKNLDISWRSIYNKLEQIISTKKINTDKIKIEIIIKICNNIINTIIIKTDIIKLYLCEKTIYKNNNILIKISKFTFYSKLILGLIDFHYEYYKLTKNKYFNNIHILNSFEIIISIYEYIYRHEYYIKYMNYNIYIISNGKIFKNSNPKLNKLIIYDIFYVNYKFIYTLI